MEVSIGGRDPYCVFREQYCNSDKPKGKHSPSIREKCDFAEMNRLISQLAEVSVCLQRTKQECELIEKRCRRKNSEIQDKNEDSNSGIFGNPSSKPVKMKIGHSISSSSYGSDSGKGSMVDYELLEGVTEGDEQEEEMDCGPQEVELSVGGTQEIGDKEVERLLNIAQRLTQQALLQRQNKGEKREWFGSGHTWL